MPADITDATTPDVLVEAAQRELGGVEVVVNIAGVQDGMTRAHHVSDEIWDHTIAVNLTAPVRLTRRALAPMLDQGHGVFVNMASIAGLVGARGGVAYTASKHGLIGVTKSVAATYARDGIRANAIAPGFTQTDFGSRGPALDDGGWELMKTTLPLNPHVADPTEIADIAVFLASGAARNMNGAVVVADAGWTAP